MRMLLALATVLLLAGAGCGSTDEAAPPTETASAPTPPPTQALQAPPIAGVTLDGASLSLADFRGKPVFVNVWSSW